MGVVLGMPQLWATLSAFSHVLQTWAGHSFDHTHEPSPWSEALWPWVQCWSSGTMQWRLTFCVSHWLHMLIKDTGCNSSRASGRLALTWGLKLDKQNSWSTVVTKISVFKLLKENYTCLNEGVVADLLLSFWYTRALDRNWPKLTWPWNLTLFFSIEFMH